MTVPFLTNQQFLQLLQDNGYSVAENTDEFWNSHDRIILIKDNSSTVIQFLKIYHYPIVVKTCESLGIEPPEDHKKCYEQVKNRKKEQQEKKDKE